MLAASNMRRNVASSILALSMLGTAYAFGAGSGMLQEMESTSCMESRRLTISGIYSSEALDKLWSVPSGAPVSVKIQGRANTDITAEDGIAIYVIPVALSKGVWPDEQYGGIMKFSFCDQWTGVECPLSAGTDFEAVITWNAIKVSTPSMGASPVLLAEPDAVSWFGIHYDIVPELEVDPRSPFSVSHPVVPESELEEAIAPEMVGRINSREDKTWTAEVSPRFDQYSVLDARRIAEDTVLRGHEPVMLELKARVYVRTDAEDPLVPREARHLRDASAELPDIICKSKAESSQISDPRRRFYEESLDQALKIYPHRARRSRILNPVNVPISLDYVIPEEFDARDGFPQCASVIGRVQDQGDCGSGWAIASTETFSDRWCIARIGKETSVDWRAPLSAEDTTACSSFRGCNGGLPAAAWKWFMTTGVVTGGDRTEIGKGITCKPYEFRQCAHHIDQPTMAHPECPVAGYPKLACSSTCSEPGYGTAYEADKRKAKSAYSLVDTASIQVDMVKHGSVTASFSVYADFLAYSGGVYKHVEGDFIGGHAVKIIGWGTDEYSGEDYWTAVNSWGQSWGENGLFRILRGVNECGIEGQIVTGEA